MTDVPAEMKPSRLSWSTISLGVLAACALLFASAMLLLVPASHDELHFAHCAWLAQQGLAPYHDFLYHNSPGILYALRWYGLWNEQFGPEVVIWGRVLCVMALVLTAVVMVAIGKRMGSAHAGLLAVVIACSMLVIPLNGQTFRKQLWVIRPEILVMPLAFAAIYWTLKLASSDKVKASFLMGLLAAASAGTALFVSPRMAFLCAGLALVVAVNRKCMSRRSLFGIAIGMLSAPALYLLLAGATDTQVWIFEYSKSIRSDGVGRFVWLRMHPGKFILVLSVLQSLYYVWRWPNKDVRNVALMQLVLMSPTFLEAAPSYPTWQVSFPLACVLFAYLVVELWTRRTIVSRVAAAGLIAVCWLYAARGLKNNAQLMAQPSRWLSAQVNDSRRLCSALAGETILIDQTVHPVALRDASYYWTQFPALRAVLTRAKIERPRLNVIGDCIEHPPAILWKQALDDVAEGEQDSQAVDDLVRREYGPTKLGFLVRNDLYDRLKPLLDSEEMAPTFLPTAPSDDAP